MIPSLLLATALAAIAVEQLAAPGWRTREQAQAALQRLGWAGVPALLVAEKGPHPERAKRATIILHRHYMDDLNRLMDLPPIGLMGRLAVGKDYDDSCVVWSIMLDCRARAYQAQGRERPHDQAGWEQHPAGDWGFSDPHELQVEATRIHCADLIERREDAVAAVATWSKPPRMADVKE